jgi:hypothetical protein
VVTCPDELLSIDSPLISSERLLMQSFAGFQDMHVRGKRLRIVYIVCNTPIKAYLCIDVYAASVQYMTLWK